jgi:hypothetical protein
METMSATLLDERRYRELLDVTLPVAIRTEEEYHRLLGAAAGSLPFSDLGQTKRRPALVLAALEGTDLILRQIPSPARHDACSVRLEAPDFVTGGLSQFGSNRGASPWPTWCGKRRPRALN